MRTVVFKNVLESVLRGQGIDPDFASSNQKARRGEIISRRVQMAWESAGAWWPEWTLVEERALREDFSLVANYAADDWVWGPTGQEYYKCILACRGIPLSNATYWTVQTDPPADKCILLEQKGKTRIGQVEGLYATEEDALLGMRPFRTVISNDRIDISDDDCDGDTVFVKFKKAAPSFRTTEYQGTTYTYEEGQVWYWPHSTGNQLQGQCYRASTDENNAGYWELMEIPEILQHYVVSGSIADALREDGQAEKAVYFDQLAAQEMDRVYDNVFNSKAYRSMRRVMVRVSAIAWLLFSTLGFGQTFTNVPVWTNWPGDVTGAVSPVVSSTTITTGDVSRWNMAATNLFRGAGTTGLVTTTETDTNKFLSSSGSFLPVPSIADMTNYLLRTDWTNWATPTSNDVQGLKSLTNAIIGAGVTNAAQQITLNAATATNAAQELDIAGLKGMTNAIIGAGVTNAAQQITLNAATATNAAQELDIAGLKGLTNAIIGAGVTNAAQEQIIQSNRVSVAALSTNKASLTGAVFSGPVTNVAPAYLYGGAYLWAGGGGVYKLFDIDAVLNDDDLTFDGTAMWDADENIYYDRISSAIAGESLSLGNVYFSRQQPGASILTNGNFTTDNEWTLAGLCSWNASASNIAFAAGAGSMTFIATNNIVFPSRHLWKFSVVGAGGTNYMTATVGRVSCVVTAKTVSSVYSNWLWCAEQKMSLAGAPSDVVYVDSMSFARDTNGYARASQGVEAYSAQFATMPTAGNLPLVASSVVAQVRADLTNTAANLVTASNALQAAVNLRIEGAAASNNFIGGASLAGLSNAVALRIGGSAATANFVNVTGDTMTGALNLNNALYLGNLIGGTNSANAEGAIIAGNNAGASEQQASGIGSSIIGYNGVAAKIYTPGAGARFVGSAFGSGVVVTGSPNAYGWSVEGCVGDQEDLVPVGTCILNGHGASFHGRNNGRVYIGGTGSKVYGYVGAETWVTNEAYSSIALPRLTNSGDYIYIAKDAHASIAAGRNITITNHHATVVGDTLESKGNGSMVTHSVWAEKFCYMDGTPLTNAAGATVDTNLYLLQSVWSNGISTPSKPTGGTYIIDPTNGWRQWIHASGAVTVQAWNALGRTNTAEAVLVHFKLAAGGTVVFDPANGLTCLSGVVTTEVPHKVMIEKPPAQTNLQYRIYQ